MKEILLTVENHEIRCLVCNTIVVGSGAAGLCAAERLRAFGQENIGIVTENLLSGTSRNAGSDKQTYYKLSLGGDSPDSIAEVAKTLFDGGCVDGDHALVEAALSVRAFYHLVELGVPFPYDQYGQYVGYKTDYDPKQRATSAGPYTSKLMTEKLEAEVQRKGIKIFDKLQAIKILTDDNARAIGLLCLDLSQLEDANARYVVFCCTNIIWATGGPGGIYSDSVYPVSQFGSTGLALEAGAKGKNLTEWQYGLASMQPRWNVSGSYMQALPRFFSTDSVGADEQEFLNQYFDNRSEMLSATFLKGYQWPFDASKVWGGSSLIDIFVYVERCLKGRRVFLDFRQNAGKAPVDLMALTSEAANYLRSAGATGNTPFERLSAINLPAIKFYRDHGVDLATQPLEIFMAAQHCNGGLSIDSNWETSIKGLFAIGEAAGSHGVHRPGGSALNAGQVGALRVAEYIGRACRGTPDLQVSYLDSVKHQVNRAILEGECSLHSAHSDSLKKKYSGLVTLMKNSADRMTKVGAAFRNLADIVEALNLTVSSLESLLSTAAPTIPTELPVFFRCKDTLYSQIACLASMKDYAERKGTSRGGALYHNDSGRLPHALLPEMFRSNLGGDIGKNEVQEVGFDGKIPNVTWRNVRPIPSEDVIFEKVWKEFRQRTEMV